MEQEKTLKMTNVGEISAWMIAEMRMNRNLTIEELAKLAKVTESTIMRIERGNGRRLSDEVLNHVYQTLINQESNRFPRWS